MLERTTTRRRHRLRATATTPPAGLGLDELAIEDLIVAVDDRLDQEADGNRRARLGRSRQVLEAELGRLLTQ